LSNVAIVGGEANRAVDKEMQTQRKLCLEDAAKRILQSNPDAKLMLSRRNLFCEYDVRSCELRLRQALRYSRTSLTRRQESATQLEPGNSNWRRQQQKLEMQNAKSKT